MSERLKALQRLAALQTRQKTLAEWRLAAVVQRQAALAEAQRRLDGFVDGGNLVGPLAQEAVLQAQRLASRSGQAEEQRRLGAEAVRRAEQRQKLTEQVVDRLAAAVRADEERRSLADLIDSLATRKPTA